MRVENMTAVDTSTTTRILDPRRQSSSMPLTLSPGEQLYLKWPLITGPSSASFSYVPTATYTLQVRIEEAYAGSCPGRINISQATGSSGETSQIPCYPYDTPTMYSTSSTAQIPPPTRTWENVNTRLPRSNCSQGSTDHYTP